MNMEKKSCFYYRQIYRARRVNKRKTKEKDRQIDREERETQREKERLKKTSIYFPSKLNYLKTLFWS